MTPNTTDSQPTTIRHSLAQGWDVQLHVDTDGHLNIYVLNGKSEDIHDISADNGDGKGEQLALRFTTNEIEAEYQRELTTPNELNT